jgi:hypothetical protein
MKLIITKNCKARVTNEGGLKANMIGGYHIINRLKKKNQCDGTR